MQTLSLSGYDLHHHFQPILVMIIDALMQQFHLGFCPFLVSAIFLVFVSVTIDLFYNGFCNNVLWPLIHYIPPPMEVGCNDTATEGQWEAYYRANQAFVDAILQVYEDKCVVIT